MAATKDSKAYYLAVMMALRTAASTVLDLVVKTGDQKVEPKAAKMVVTVTNSVDRKVGPSVGSRDERWVAPLVLMKVGSMAATMGWKAYYWAVRKGLRKAASMDQRLVGSLASRMAASMAATKDSKAYC